MAVGTPFLPFRTARGITRPLTFLLPSCSSTSSSSFSTFSSSSSSGNYSSLRQASPEFGNNYYFYPITTYFTELI